MLEQINFFVGHVDISLSADYKITAAISHN